MLCFVLFLFVYLSDLLSGSFLLAALIMLALLTGMSVIMFFSALCQLIKKAQVFISIEGSSTLSIQSIEVSQIATP